MRRAAKVDANQEQIVTALKAAGACVQSLAAIGKGCPDILVGYGQWLYLMEVKNRAGKNKASEHQVKWHAEWKTKVFTVHTPDEALRVIGAIA